MCCSTDEGGTQFNPHVESSESDHSVVHSDEVSSDVEETNAGINQSEKGSTSSVVHNAKSVVSPDGSTIWTPVCDESYKPHINKYFPSLEEAYLFYVEYGRQCGFDVRKSTKKSDRRGNVLKQYFQCSNGGSPTPNQAKLVEDFVNEGSQKNRRTTSRRCNCKAQIIVKSAGVRGFVVMSFVDDHNHPLASERDKMFLRCNRDVSVTYQNFIMDCSRANIGPTRAHGLAKEMVGSFEDVGATCSDFKNFARDVKVQIGDHDADMILSKFKLKKESSNNTFYYDYKVDREGHLTGLFWTDAIGQANFEVFGDVVSFDPTFRTNKYNMVFVPFTGVDSHWKNVTFAAALIAKEDYKSFKWLIRCFEQAMGRLPNCVITDQCPAIKKALRLNWPAVKHRLCMWHIMNKLPAKIGPTLASNKKFMDRLKSIVYSEHCSPLEFEEGWNAVMSEYNLEDNKWLAGMFRRRARWIPAYFYDIEMAGLLRTTSRSESSNAFFQHFHESGDTLVEFYSSFESAMDKQRLRSAEDDRRSQQTPQTETTMPIEKDAANIYTLPIYYKVREQIKSACYHTSMVDMSRDNDTRHFTCMDDMVQGRLFKVSVRQSDDYVECSCNFYFRKGYLCSHAFAALRQSGVHKIPRVLVKSRWVKNAVKLHSTLGSSNPSALTDKSDRTKMKRTRAWFVFHNCMNYAGNDEEKVDYLMSGLDEISSKLHKPSDTREVQRQSHRAENFVGPVPQKDVSVQNPLTSRNKGCGSRIKSSMETSIETRKGRTCSNCNKIEGHNSRTCPLNKKS